MTTLKFKMEISAKIGKLKVVINHLTDMGIYYTVIDNGENHAYLFAQTGTETYNDLFAKI